MEQDLTTTQIQIISENGDLIDDFKYRAQEPDLAKFGKNYHIVSIIGNQSTGKSTLLNKLFGTTFDIMDSSRVRKQTTKGIMISKDQGQNILVFDVEGADCKERWDAHEPFEQCTALFSLVLSQVLLVNIWTHEVGRFVGSNYGIMKVIFENNLKLFKQEGSKKLVFILRDYHAESENQETIKDTIRRDIAKIWADITKPKEYSISTPEQFFEFEFVFLTNYRFLRPVFEQQTNDFRQQFTDQSHPDYFFKHHRTNDNVPIDGLYLLMENVWTTIKDCKDINLPSQKTLVANLRCTDIKNEIISSLEGRIRELKNKASKGIYEDFGQEGEQIIKQASDSYDTQTENYEKTVVVEKRKELISSVLQSLHDSFEAQVSTIRKTAITELTSKLDGIRVNPNNLGNVMENVRAVQNQVTERFEDALRKAVVGSDWNIELVKSEVREQIESTVAMFKEKQLVHILKRKSTDIRREIEAQIARQFNTLNNDFWTVLDNFYNETVRAAEGYVKNMLSDSFELSSESARSQVATLNEDAYHDLEIDLKHRFQDLQHFMLRKFRITFGQNEHRVPINWKTLTPQQISDRYVTAKRECKTLTQNLKYFLIRKRGEDYLDRRPVLPEREFDAIVSRLEEDYEREYYDAERKRAANETKSIPKWFWVILIFFMYDDVLQWIKNPLIVGVFIYPLFFVICIIALLFATGYGSNMMSVFSSFSEIIKLLLGAQLKRLGINI